MTAYEKPLPVVNIDTAPFWEYCRQHELRMQKCTQCGHVRYPPGMICPRCHSMEAEWVRLSGKGTVYSYTVIHRLYHKAFKDDIPYVGAIVHLDEGPGMLSNVIGCKVVDIKIDMPVEVYFDDVTDNISLPKFKPVT
ncbi:Zn-ribbon domain-containing OB-fold protein [Chloroflexota bacterium]